MFVAGPFLSEQNKKVWLSLAKVRFFSMLKGRVGGLLPKPSLITKYGIIYVSNILPKKFCMLLRMMVNLLILSFLFVYQCTVPLHL